MFSLLQFSHFSLFHPPPHAAPPRSNHNLITAQCTAYTFSLSTFVLFGNGASHQCNCFPLICLHYSQLSVDPFNFIPIQQLMNSVTNLCNGITDNHNVVIDMKARGDDKDDDSGGSGGSDSSGYASNG